MIFKRVFRQAAAAVAAAAGVVNLPRAGRGETIVRSRNSERRPGRLLPRDYINAVDASRRLRIGRCPPPFLASPSSTRADDGRTSGWTDVWNATWGPLACRGRERRYDYRKHTFLLPTSAHGFFVSSASERTNQEESKGKRKSEKEGEGERVETTTQLAAEGHEGPRKKYDGAVLVFTKFVDPRGWPGRAGVAILQ